MDRDEHAGISDEIVTAISNLASDLAEQHAETIALQREMLAVLTEIRDRVGFIGDVGERSQDVIGEIARNVEAIDMHFSPPMEDD